MQYGACYIRVSTEEQTEFSPDAQLKAIMAYAKKNDILISERHIYTDEGISGRRADKRPAFMRMIAAAKTKPKPFDVILVHKFDRFARSREDSVVYKSLLKKEAGIKVVSITESIEDDKFSVILEAMLEAMAEYYSLNLSEEVKKGMTEKATRGEYQSAPPFGYNVVNKLLIVEPEEARYVKFIFEQFSGNKMGLRQLAAYLNDLGIRTKRGNPFENRTIEYILNNPLYAGKVRWTPTGKTRRNFHNPDSIIAQGGHEPIISNELWEAAQKALGEQKALFGKYQKPNAVLKTWLKGLVRCSSCGSVLVQSGAQYLQCNGYAKGACRVSHCINMHALENAVVERLKETYPGKLEISIVPKAQDKEKMHKYNLLLERMNKLDFREERIKNAFQDGIDSLEEYKANKQKIEADKSALQKQMELLAKPLKGNNKESQNIAYRIHDVYSLLSDEVIPLEIKYKTAHFLINKITFYKSEKTIEIEYK